jgi:hypothetical protein
MTTYPSEVEFSSYFSVYVHQKSEDLQALHLIHVVAYWSGSNWIPVQEASTWIRWRGPVPGAKLVTGIIGTSSTTGSYNTLLVRQLFLARNAEYYGTDLSPPAKLFRPKSYDNELVTSGKNDFFKNRSFWKKNPDSGPLRILMYWFRYIFSCWHIVRFLQGRLSYVVLYRTFSIQWFLSQQVKFLAVLSDGDNITGLNSTQV